MVNFKGKQAAVLGLGIEGQDLCRFLLKNKAKVTVFDQKTTDELGKSYQEFKDKGIKFVLGKNYLKSGIKGYDFIFRSPGFHPRLTEIITAKKAGAKIFSAIKLFFDLCPGKIIGVTGTKGKGTTATLIYQILKKGKKDVYLAGNIGQPVLSLLPKIKSSSWVVLELSSFQLMDLQKSPKIAVVLFITSEHLDYHANTQEYVQAKMNLVSHQKNDDFAVINADSSTSIKFANKTEAKVYYFSRSKKVRGSYAVNQKIFMLNQLIGQTKNLKIPGQHNWGNVCAAITASYLAGASIGSIKKTVFTFRGLEHRLEKVRNLKGVSYYNDSFSTTPETAIAAVKSFDQPVILIAGGSEKGSDYHELGQEIGRSKVKTLILIGQMAGKIKEAVERSGFQGQIIFRPKSMKDAVDLAFKEAKPGEVVLLSPACASFDMFENYKDRGYQFKKLVKQL